MTGTVAGQTVRIITQKLGEGVFSPSFYWVAEPDPAKAVEIIRLALGATPDEKIEMVGTLSDGDILGLGLEPGQYQPGA